MKGLIIWAQSDCRSTMGLYSEIIKQAECHVVIALWFYRKTDTQIDNRMEVGFRSDEFGHVKMVPVGDDYAAGLKLLDEHQGYDHLFAVYQTSAVWRKLIVEAKLRGGRIFVASEAPCNMNTGIMFFLKEIYMRFLLRYKVTKVIAFSEMFFNLSGYDDKYAKLIGWKSDQIIPFGYYPPPIPNTKRVLRQNNIPFTILSTGVLSKYRGADVLVDALKILKDRGVTYTATITQDGELNEKLQEKARRYGLPISFPGFLKMDALIHEYEGCSVYVAAGRHEPWGMRLNDALNCAAPLVVSRGMGGVKLIDDYKCGLSFRNGDAIDLADKLEKLARDTQLYLDVARNAYEAYPRCQPSTKAMEMLEILERGYQYETVPQD